MKIPIDIADAPIGMRLFHQGGYFEAVVAANGKHKEWVPLPLTQKKQTGGNFETTPTTLGPPGLEQHTWDHHHAPFYQVFNNYVCLKKETLGELRDFFFELFSQKGS